MKQAAQIAVGEYAFQTAPVRYRQHAHLFTHADDGFFQGAESDGEQAAAFVHNVGNASRRLPGCGGDGSKAKSSGVNARLAAVGRPPTHRQSHDGGGAGEVEASQRAGFFETDAVMWMSAWRAMWLNQGGRWCEQRIFAFERGDDGVSSLSRVEIATTTSLSWSYLNRRVPLPQMDKRGRAGRGHRCRRLRPICPDLPMPVITTLPLQCNNASAAGQFRQFRCQFRANASLRCATLRAPSRDIFRFLHCHPPLL